MSGQQFPDLTEQIRLELERITRAQADQPRMLNFDHEEEEEEEEHSIRLVAQLDLDRLTLNSSSLPSNWGPGKEIMLNGMRFCPVLGDRSNAPSPAPSPSSKRVSHAGKEVSHAGREEKLAPPPPPAHMHVVPDKENFAPAAEMKTASSMRRRKSQDLTNQVEDVSSGFLAKLTRHGTYVDRWCELDAQTKAFKYWKNAAARTTIAPTVIPISQIVSVQWNAKDIKEGKRRNLMGLGGARFVIVTNQGEITWRAKDPLLAIRWIDGLQDLMDQTTGKPEKGAQPEANVEEKCGPLQRMNKSGRYKDRWCELDAKNKTLSYWAKKSLWEAQRPPKGVINFTEVSSIVWNPDDVRKGKRRSLLTKDGVRFAFHFNDQSIQQWRSDNPLEASEWSRILGSVHCKILPRTVAVGRA